MTAFWWALVTACIWGIVPLIEKVGIRATEPLPGLFARTCGVVVGLLVFGLLASPWQAVASMGWPSFLLLALGGLLASFVGQMTFYHALKVGELTQIVPLAGTYPLVAALVGWVLMREPLTGSRVLGVLLVVSGVWFLHR